LFFVEIRIGVVDSPREVVIEVLDTADDVATAYRSALGLPDGVLRLADAKGRLVLIPVARITYLDLGSPEHRPVGFGVLEQ